MTDNEQAKLWLEMYKSARARFHEIESIRWKFNYSIWAFLAGIAYLIKANRLHAGYFAYIAFFALPFGIHLGVLLKVVHQLGHWREAAIDYDLKARTLINRHFAQMPKAEKAKGEKDREERNTRCKDYAWIVLELLITLMIAIAVAYLNH